MDKVTASVKNVNIKIGAGLDESKYNSKIKDLMKEVDEMKSILGDKIFQAFLNDEVFDHKPCCVKIKTICDNIDTLEKEKQEMLDEMAAEREKNRKGAETKKE